jgi:hypothetical protein
MITISQKLSHWNYFLALEADLARLARFVEFSENNFSTYSIEIAHLLLASASEVDVVLKQLCSRLLNGNKVDGINNYRQIILTHAPAIVTTTVNIPRFGLKMVPWSNWQNTDLNPDWWHAYNKVKYERVTNFEKANLKNLINAMGGLFISLIFLYRGQTDNDRISPVPNLFMAPLDLIQRQHTLGGETVLKYTN